MKRPGCCSDDPARTHDPSCSEGHRRRRWSLARRQSRDGQLCSCAAFCAIRLCLLQLLFEECAGTRPLCSETPLDDPTTSFVWCDPTASVADTVDLALSWATRPPPSSRRICPCRPWAVRSLAHYYVLYQRRDDINRARVRWPHLPLAAPKGRKSCNHPGPDRTKKRSP